MNSKTALFIIDAQMNMFDPEHPVHDAKGILMKLQSLLTLARASSTQVVFIQNNGGPGEVDEPRTEGWLIHPELMIRDGDLLIQKTQVDAFTETDLAARLRRQGIQKLVIAGMQSEYCIAGNCRKARELGFDVVLVTDAHTTYASQGKEAFEIIDAVNDSLRDVVTFWHVQDLLNV